MHHAEANELDVLEPRDQREHAGLFTALTLLLESNQAAMVTGQIVLTQLNRCVRRATGSRVPQPHWLHGSEAQGVPTPVRHHFDRQATLEELLLVEVVHSR